jgi:hypothetical protein
MSTHSPPSSSAGTAPSSVPVQRSPLSLGNRRRDSVEPLRWRLDRSAGTGAAVRPADGPRHRQVAPAGPGSPLGSGG